VKLEYLMLRNST
jgi:hypothetical protein